MKNVLLTAILVFSTLVLTAQNSAIDVKQTGDIIIFVIRKNILKEKQELEEIIEIRQQLTS
jgi:hypothetical protein